MKYTLLLFLILIAARLQAQSFEPGIWKSKESIQLNGMPFPPSDGEECIGAAQARDARGAIEKELKRVGCTLTRWEVKNQKLEAGVNCNNDNFDATGHLRGSFTSKSYDLKGEAKGTIRQALPATADLHLTGQWMRKCP